MSDIDEATGVPEPARVESWLRTLIGFGDARVVTVVALTDGLSNVTCRVNLTDAPVAAAVLRIQPTRGIFEPYNILREGEVLNHLAGTAVPVPGVLASESDPRFFGAPFLLLESIDAAHMPAPEADFATFAADLPAFAAALAAIHAIDWRAVGLDFLAYRVRPLKDSRVRSESRCATHVGVWLRRRAAAEPITDGIACVHPEGDRYEVSQLVAALRATR